MAETKEKDYSIESLIIDACEEYDEGYDGDINEDDMLSIPIIDDTIHEIADSAVPIYYWDIAQYAAHNSWLMTVKPDINTDGNAHDQIQANIYCAVYDGLVEHINEKETEDE